MPYDLRFPDYNTISIDEFTRMCDDLNQDNDIICPVLISTRHDTAIVATIPSRIADENPGAVQALLGAGIDVRLFDMSTGDITSPSVSPPSSPSQDLLPGNTNIPDEVYLYTMNSGQFVMDMTTNRIAMHIYDPKMKMNILAYPDGSIVMPADPKTKVLKISSKGFTVPRFYNPL